MPTTTAIRRIAPRPLLLIAGIENRGERRVLRKYHTDAGVGAELWEVAGASHVQSWTVSREDYEAKVLALFERALLK